MSLSSGKEERYVFVRPCDILVRRGCWCFEKLKSNTRMKKIMSFVKRVQDQEAALGLSKGRILQVVHFLSNTFSLFFNATLAQDPSPSPIIEKHS